MRKLLLTISAIAAVTAYMPSMAETGNAGYAGDFMRFGLGARPLGMGGAFAAIAEGFEACYYNPAGLALYPVRQAGFTYHSLTLDRQLNSAALISPVRNEAVMGISWIYGGVGDVQMRDSDRNLAGIFANNSNAVALTFSKMATEYLSLGANVRYLQSKLDELTAYTVGADFGAIARYKKMASVGISLQNFGSDLKWDSGKYWSQGGKSYMDRVPVRIRGGVAALLFDETFIGALDVVKDLNMNIRINLGAEYWFTTRVKELVENEEGEGEALTETMVSERLFGLRTGYNDGSFTFGGSLMYPFGNLNGGFDYAYMTGRRDEGSNHVFTLRVLF
jgi:hypothetical protein